MINLVTIEIIIYIITVLFSIVLFICTMLYIKNHKCKSSILSVKEMLLHKEVQKKRRHIESISNLQ